MDDDRIHLKRLDRKKWVTLLPQVLGALIATSLHLVAGQILSYSGILIPQLMEEQNNGNGSSIFVNEANSAWIASAPAFSSLIVSVPIGLLVDHIGRLRTVILSIIPGIIGYVLIATATSVSMIIWGRIITGVCFSKLIVRVNLYFNAFSTAFLSHPTGIYISEISHPNLRGSFLTLIQINVSLGIVLVYLKGSFLHWRTVAWLTNVYITVPIVIMFFFLPESPAWLVSKGHIAQARDSIAWFYKYYPASSNMVEEKVIELIRDQERKQTDSKFEWKEQIKMFLLPTFYKPFLILMVLFCFQQNSGISIIIFNSVIFFKDIGSNIDPYVASIYLTAMKFVMSLVAALLMNKFNRRTLFMFGALGMAVSMAISGLNTQWIQVGESNQKWIPLACLLLYIMFSCMGISTMPFLLSNELFPLKIRGVSYSVILSFANMMAFFVLQTYLPLYHVFGGSTNFQYFLALMSIGTAIVMYVFLPETHNFKLIEIENHFKKHTIYLSSRYADEAKASRVMDNLL
ncbi:hypothetical protein FQA39_LY16882 [Lamprigera yunnana]|nr:hypothetical protein FQA39_LY16882 [Lamprigera yunnana]